MSKRIAPLPKSEENIKLYIHIYKGVDPNNVRFLQTELAAHSGKSYDLEIVSPSEMEDFQFYKDLGIRYFLVLPDTYLSGKVTSVLSPAFLSDLRNDPDSALLVSFEPNPDSKPGPLIEIYEVKAGPDR